MANPANPAASSQNRDEKFSEILATRRTIAQLQSGGYVLYLRHGPTDNSRPDRVPAVDLNDCRSQRPLTADGRQLAARIGKTLRQLRIPLHDIHVSPLCRTRDTASAAFPGQPLQIDHQLMYTANLTDAQKAPILARTRQLLTQPVKAGSNRLLIAHAPNLMDLIGYFPKEGTLVIFRPAARREPGIDYIASIPASHWAELMP